jgi:hypothetical protein
MILAITCQCYSVGVMVTNNILIKSKLDMRIMDSTMELWIISILFQAIYFAIPIGCGFLVFQGWRWTRNYNYRIFGFAFIALGALGLTVSLWALNAWISFMNSGL